MKIIHPHDKYTGWITVEIDGFSIQARVFDQPSDYGVERCRVSKLYIYKTSKKDKAQGLFTNCIYGYDRGHKDVDIAPTRLLKKVLKELNGLPTLVTKSTAPTNLPKKIIRLDDGAEFLLNETEQKYFLWSYGCENHLCHFYTWDTLMVANKGSFKVADGREDLFAMGNSWFLRVSRSKND